jgi:hypothetical protein
LHQQFFCSCIRFDRIQYDTDTFCNWLKEVKVRFTETSNDASSITALIYFQTIPEYDQVAGFALPNPELILI